MTCFVFVGACKEASPTPTGPTEVTLSNQYFSGTLAARGSKFFSFSVAAPGGTVTATLASVTSPASGAALPVVVGLGYGIPSGTGCALRKSIETPAALTAQLIDAATAGVYCVSVYDIGHLASDVNFALRFSHP